MMVRLLIRYTSASLAAAFCSSALGQLSIIDSYDRCVGDSSAFARDEKLNEVVTEYLADIQRKINSSGDESKIAGMAGLGERSVQARSKADQYREELQQACAHISQSINATDKRGAEIEPIVPIQDPQTAEPKR